MIAAKAEPQRLKPLRFCGIYVVAEATTHKDSQDFTKDSRLCEGSQYSIRDAQGPEKGPRVDAL
jgi:hypothetical protein